MSFWKKLSSVGQALLNPAAAVFKAVQRDAVYEAAGAANSSLAPVSNITDRLDKTSVYTADDLTKILNERATTSNVPAAGFDFMAWLKENIMLVGAACLGVFFLMYKPSKK